MKSVLTSLVFVLAFQMSAFGQQAAWNVDIAQNTTASSNLTVINQCRASHQFKLQRQNLPFLTFAQEQIQVGGGQTVNVPARFDTVGLALGPHQGQLTIACLTCKNEVGCTQDKDVLNVVVNVTSPPVPTFKPTPKPSPTGTGGTQFNGPPRLAGQTEWQINARNTGVLFDRFVAGGCVNLAGDCEKLREKAAELEAAAVEAQSKADAAKKAADDADAAAKKAEADAQKAADAAKPANSGGSITSDGETFDGADSAWLEEKKKKLFEDWQAGRVTAEQHQAKRAELSGTEALRKAREERLANEAKLKKGAENARAAAEKARRDAENAKADAAAAQKAADDAKAAADKALEEYRKCLKAIEDECARIAAEKKKKDKEARTAAIAQGEKDKKKRDEEARSAAQQAEIDYLLDNFKRLGLITHLPNTKVPDALDPAFDALQKITGESIRNFLQQVAGQVGGGPIDPNYINALGEAYKAMSALFNMRTKAGLERVHRLLTTKIINPKTGKIYTEDQAWNKIKRMEDLMEKIKAKLALHGK